MCFAIGIYFDSLLYASCGQLQVSEENELWSQQTASIAVQSYGGVCRQNFMTMEKRISLLKQKNFLSSLKMHWQTGQKAAFSPHPIISTGRTKGYVEECVKVSEKRTSEK